MFLDGNAKVGEAKVYATKKEYSLEKELEVCLKDLTDVMNKLYDLLDEYGIEYTNESAVELLNRYVDEQY